MATFQSTDRLEGSKNEVGGLIIKKKSADVDDSNFKRPSESLLGLKKLADEKRKQRYEEEKVKRNSKTRSAYDDNVDEDVSKRKKYRKDERHYRSFKPETPSHPGGVNEDAQTRIRKRQERGRDKGVYADSREVYKKRRDDEDDKVREPRSSREYSKGDRNDKREIRSHRDKSSRYYEKDRERNKEGSTSTRRGYEQWEDTPSQSRRSEDDSERRTPRVTPRGIPYITGHHLML